MSDKNKRQGTSDEKQAKLLNCPFCGGDAVTAEMYNTKLKKLFPIVKCLDCECRTPMTETFEEAIKAWNTRKPMEGIIDYLEEFMEKQYDSYNNAKRTGNIRQMDYSDGCAEGLIEAIEIIKIEGGIE